MAAASCPKFRLSFNIGKTNEERIEAFELYQEAFNARKLWEGTPPDGSDIHILMEMNGVETLLGPGDKVEKVLENAVTHEFHYDNEQDLLKAYDALKREGSNCSQEGPYPWATLLALVVDKFGIAWALYYQDGAK